MPHISTIIWDWNGTLLNDRDLCLKSINQLLKKRDLPELYLERYLEVFQFPVKNYYEAIGFDFNKEPFDIPANEFIENCTREIDKCRLYDNSEKVLSTLNELGFDQFILSAMEQSKLTASIKNYAIEQYFKGISGLEDDYAESKIDLGKKFIHRFGIEPKSVYMIGDTLHDLEVAEAMGCETLLIANGHQSKSRLKQRCKNVIDDICEVIDFVKSANEDKKH